METISSMNNRWVKLAAQLKIRKYREKTDLFLVEGVRSVEDAFLQGRRDGVCFVTDRALAEPRIQSLTENAGQLHWLFLRVEEAMMECLSGTAHGQGVLVILKKRKQNLRSFWKTGRALCSSGQHSGSRKYGDDSAYGGRGRMQRRPFDGGMHRSLFGKAVRSSMGSILRLPVLKE